VRHLKVVALLRACHPEPTAAVTAVSAGLALATGRDWPGVLAVAGAVLAGQLSVGWLNDSLDADRDRVAGRTDKPVAAGAVPARVVAVAAGVAGVACVGLSLLSGVVAGSLHIAAVASAWAYDLGVKATVASVLPYTVSFGLLPAFVVTGLPGTPAPPVWLVAAGALLGSGAHFANTLPDLADDEAAGVRGLPHRLGATASSVLAALLLLAATAVLAFGPPGGPEVLGTVALATAVTALAAGAVLGRRPRSRAPFRAVLVVALVDVVTLLAVGDRIAG
jgi:4-hydroxybenzoate polyprenyltransferase